MDQWIETILMDHLPVRFKGVIVQRVRIAEHLADSRLLAFLNAPVAQVDGRDRAVLPRRRIIAGVEPDFPLFDDSPRRTVFFAAYRIADLRQMFFANDIIVSFDHGGLLSLDRVGMGGDTRHWL
jgi:hypothetical protein